MFAREQDLKTHVQSGDVKRGVLESVRSGLCVRRVCELEAEGWQRGLMMRQMTTIHRVELRALQVV